MSQIEFKHNFINPKFQKSSISMVVANMQNRKSIKTEIAMFCYCIVELRSVGCKCLNSAEPQNIAMEICFSILKASWHRKYMFVNNIHRRGVWIEYGSHLHLQ